MPLIHRGFILSMAALPLALAVGLTAACNGGDDSDDEAADGGTPAAHQDDAEEDGDAGRTSFDVSMGDNFFEAEEFTVSPGQEVTFNLTNDGAAVHNMRVAGADDEYSNDDDAVSDPPQSSAGETATLVWIAPEEPGTYDFRCDFHPIEMIGTITVQ